MCVSLPPMASRKINKFTSRVLYCLLKTFTSELRNFVIESFRTSANSSSSVTQFIQPHSELGFSLRRSAVKFRIPIGQNARIYFL